MKQITINTLRNGIIIKSKSYFVDAIDSIIIDTINDYLSLKQSNSILLDNKVQYQVSIEEPQVLNRYDLYNEFKQKLIKEQDVNSRAKQRLEKLQKQANKRNIFHK